MTGGSYPTHQRKQKHKRRLLKPDKYQRSEAKPGWSRVAVYMGGTTIRIDHQKGDTGPRVAPTRVKRGAIRAFSSHSRRRLWRLFGTVDCRDLPPPLFINLTYPDAWPDERAVKRHLDVFWKRFAKWWRKRTGRRLPAIWRLEYQRRGAPHFHILALLGPIDSALELLLHRWIAWNWCQVVSPHLPDDELRASDHYRVHVYRGRNRNGWAVQLLRSWRGARSYLSKYLAKYDPSEAYPEGVGRFWGVVGRAELPVTVRCFWMRGKLARRLQRIMRQYVASLMRAKGRFRRKRRRSGAMRRKRAKDPPGYCDRQESYARAVRRPAWGMWCSLDWATAVKLISSLGYVHDSEQGRGPDWLGLVVWKRGTGDDPFSRNRGLLPGSGLASSAEIPRQVVLYRAMRGWRLAVRGRVRRVRV